MKHLSAFALAKTKEVRDVLEDPEASDLEKCRALFEGRSFPCVECGKTIEWKGACDECLAEFDKRFKVYAPSEALREVGVPSNLRAATWDSFMLPKTKSFTADQAILSLSEVVARIKLLRDWGGSPVLVVIAGPPGTGKSHMAAACVRRDAKAYGHQAIWWVHAEVLGKELMQFGGDDHLIQRCLRARLLVVDDFGRGTGTGALEQLCAFICRRHDEERKTIITTNYTATDFENVDERLYSRLVGALQVATRGMRDWRKGNE